MLGLSSIVYESEIDIIEYVFVPLMQDSLPSSM